MRLETTRQIPLSGKGVPVDTFYDLEAELPCVLPDNRIVIVHGVRRIFVGDALLASAFFSFDVEVINNGFDGLHQFVGHQHQLIKEARSMRLNRKLAVSRWDKGIGSAAQYLLMDDAEHETFRELGPLEWLIAFSL
ncbi:hypothetical protein OCF84_21380 (plasmid) [Shewanella xiamenensis]|uniref:Uncharacterized protein n=1 Tax=Shewanella xiamenensis TaxID=332186 RepID=A0ABT6UFQ8_9GAMM|nr:hypothetical protein [Shewanella xiamenensis]MDI5832570.1 hypothetical protein [Shewanella xiamenensis]WHF57811.1 hypothetical protein OCF84_21380 [Shewanella xiamenensis]